MAKKSCSEEQYSSKSGKCCRRCVAGTYKQKDCDETAETQCSECGRGFFMATRNHMDNCRECKKCNSNHKQTVMQECTAREDTICACVSGFYCSEVGCEHCRPVSHCPEGQGVKTLASRTNDTVCSPCETGTFSNVSDHLSHCQSHTRCEDFGKELRTPGTATTDAVCGDFKTSCGWMLPAGLWVGLVLTSLTLLVLVLCCRRIRRCRLQRTENLSRAEAPVDEVPAEEVQLKLPLPSKELNELYQVEIYRPSYSCELPAFETDGVKISCDAQHDDDNNSPITPVKASVSFTETQLLNSSSEQSTGHFHRTISEPQEDEWCGT